MTLNARTAAMVRAAGRRNGRCRIIPSKGSYTGPDSSSQATHAGGGAIDLVTGARCWRRTVKAMRRVGFAAWYRNWPGNRHIHAVAISDPDIATEIAFPGWFDAREQIVAFAQRKNGLNGADHRADEARAPHLGAVQALPLACGAARIAWRSGPRGPRGAGEGNRTPISGLGSQRLGHWTTPAGSRECTHAGSRVKVVRPRVYWPITLAAAALIALLTYGVASTGPDTSLDEALNDGERVEAPVKELPVLGSQATGSLADHRGKVVVLNVWASWCPPCKSEMPLLQRTHDAIEDRGGVVLGIDTQDASEEALEFLREKRITFPSLRDVDREYGRDFGVSGVPGDVPDRPRGPDREDVPRPRHPGVAGREPRPAARGAGMRYLVALVLLLGLTAAAPQTTLPDVEDEVMCVECGTALNVSSAAVADQERAFIRARIDEGMTKARDQGRARGRVRPGRARRPREPRLRRRELARADRDRAARRPRRPRAVAPLERPAQGAGRRPPSRSSIRRTRAVSTPS